VDYVSREVGRLAVVRKNQTARPNLGAFLQARSSLAVRFFLVRIEAVCREFGAWQCGSKSHPTGSNIAVQMMTGWEDSPSKFIMLEQR